MFKNKPNKYLFLIILLLLFTAVGFGFAPGQQNLLKNGSFEDEVKGKIPVNWGTEYYNCFVEKGGPAGDQYLRITNEKPIESLGAQSIPMDGEKTRRVFVSAYVKGENIVPGKIRWQKGNLQVLFFDKDGNQVGGWPELGPWTGTFDWTFVKKGFVVPREAKTLKIILGLYRATGSIYFDDIKVYEIKEKEEDPYNFISNGDFEIWENWAYGGTEGGGLFSPGYNSDSCLKIDNPTPNWSFASQSIGLDGRSIKRINIEGYVKTEDIVAGEKPWQKGRLNIEFKDKNGIRIGGWPIVYEISGTIPWRKVSNSFDVPAETRRVDLFAGLLEVSGTIYFDDLKLEAYDDRGNKVKKISGLKTDTRGWFSVDAEAKVTKGSAVDVSSLLDPPAGKHGFMKVKNGHFYFADGTRARFWGTNIYGEACFPDHKTAEKMADRLAKYGCNLVRMHHMDAFWSDPNIFDPSYDDTQHLSKDSLEKFDYLVWQLKKRGIYIFLDLLVDREFKEGDNVADYKNVGRGAKFTGYFNKRVIALQKKFAEQILLHYNPYTKKKYIDDPAVVSVKLINEAMLYYLGTMKGMSEVHMKEFNSMWNKWLLNKYGSKAALKKAWTDKYGKSDLKDHEDPSKGNVARGKTIMREYRSDWDKIETAREEDTMRFYYDVQVDYFKDMQKYLKGLGVKVPLSGSNHWVNIDADVKSNAELDYIDRHRYWDHPQLGYGTQIIFNNAPMVKFPETSLANNFAYYKVSGVPFAISEWNCSFPNEYRIEGPMIMAAYACLQDWDAVLQFSFSGADWHETMYDNFDIGGWPNVFGQWPAASLMFFRGDVSAAKNVIEETVSENEIFSIVNEDKPLANEPFLPFISRVQKKYVKGRSEMVNIDANISEALKFHNKSKKAVSSDTQEIKWFYGDGIFKINTGKTQGSLGFLEGSYIELDNLGIASQTDFASIFLSSRDGRPIGSSSRMLLTAGSRVENTDMVYNASKSQMIDIGRTPVLVEGVKASISIKTNKTGTPTVYALDMNGNRTKTISAKRSGNYVSFDIKQEYKTLFYEVVLK